VLICINQKHINRQSPELGGPTELVSDIRGALLSHPLFKLNHINRRGSYSEGACFLSFIWFCRENFFLLIKHLLISNLVN
jgi:hypothetical protein